MRNHTDAQVGDYVHFKDLWGDRATTQPEFEGDWEGEIVRITPHGNWHVYVNPETPWPWRRPNNEAVIDPRQWTISFEPTQTLRELLHEARNR